jgi:hypothetical protein
MPIGPILALFAIGVVEAFAAIEAIEAIEAIADNDPRGSRQPRVGARDPRGASTWRDGGRWTVVAAGAFRRGKSRNEASSGPAKRPADGRKGMRGCGMNGGREF